MKGKEDEASKEKLKITIEAIADESDKKYKGVMEGLNKIKPDGGKIDSQKFWKIKKKLFPKSCDPPSAMLDQFQNLLTTQDAIEARAIEVYSERLQPNKMKEHLKSLEETTNKLCELRLKLLKLKLILNHGHLTILAKL